MELHQTKLAAEQTELRLKQVEGEARAREDQLQQLKCKVGGQYLLGCEGVYRSVSCAVLWSQQRCSDKDGEKQHQQQHLIDFPQRCVVLYSDHTSSPPDQGGQARGRHWGETRAGQQQRLLQWAQQHSVRGWAGRWFYWNTEKNNGLKNFEGNYNWLELYKRNIILSGLDGRIIIVYKYMKTKIMACKIWRHL